MSTSHPGQQADNARTDPDAIVPTGPGTDPTTDPTTDPNTDPAATHVGVIDVTPRTWTAVLPILIAVLINGDGKGQKMAIEELRRMAQAADLGLQTAQTLNTPDSDGATASTAFGFLAHQAGLQLALQVLSSPAGFYIGTAEADGPFSRESREYWPTEAEAIAALASGAWTQRDSA